MPATDELNVLTPGTAPETDHDDAPLDPKDARIAELETLVAQQQGQLSDQAEQLKGLQTVPSRQDNGKAASRLIGEDWSHKTVAEAKAAGVQFKVLTKEGYYIPPEL